MRELVFSINDIFNAESQDGCLAQYDCKGYHIPAYQRGYKWGTESNGAVTVLLNDLWDAYQAFKKQESKEYYLQYITVKKASDAKLLEVIDGQQRLTTLSILLSVMSATSDIENISCGKLNYAIRDNFFSNHIYNKDSLVILLNKEWKDLEVDSNYNKQDIFYLFSAAKYINKFYLDKTEEQTGFYNYVLKNVKLIVNSVEPHVLSETVFRNLNSNKVPLTETELIKGLLITKVGRGDSNNEQRKFKEIVEVRINLGRYWDELKSWAECEEINTFYFEGKDGMHQMLLLVAQYLKIDKSIESGTTQKFPLFNAFHKNSKAFEVYQALKDIRAILIDWYQQDDIYNLIGYCRFAKNSKYNNIKFLVDLLSESKSKVKQLLQQYKDELLPKDIRKLRYGEDNNEIHAALLALSIFGDSQKVRFNFYEFISEKWSLEHIFPQSPEGKDSILSDENKNAILTMLGDKSNEEVERVLGLPDRNEYEKQIYYNALKEYGPINYIGNMCLLSSSDNSSNGCKFFKEKRMNILNLIQRGSFVPKHTFDVFSKMIPGLDSSLELWSLNDINQHAEYIINTLNQDN